MNVAIIPARGNSKRIPKKNIREFHGRPMISWSIEAARVAGCFERIIVSTDDSEIAEVARQWGAEVPFERPSNLSDDHTGTAAVIRHAVEWLRNNKCNPELVCCLYATAPFVTAKSLLEGLKLMKESDLAYAFTITSFPYPVQRALLLTPKGRVNMFYPEHMNLRSQDLEEAYHDAGQFYWGRPDAWLKESPLFGSHSAPIILPRYRVQDIDTLEDWVRAEYMFEVIQRTLQHSLENETDESSNTNSTQI